MTEKIRWGIIGLGRIARAFAEGLRHAPNATLHSVASRNPRKAKAFAAEWKVPFWDGSYQALMKREEVDAVYIATPHSEHAEQAMSCMKMGKAVLCEKPLAINARQVSSMIDCAKENKVLLMEGMWSRFPPLMKQVRNIIKSGELGEIKTLHADFGFIPLKRDPVGRLLNPKLAGGSLLDVGIYPISLSFMIFGKPKTFATACHIGETGVDEQGCYVFKYNGGAMSVLHSSFLGNTSQEAFISGTEGTIKIHRQCWKPQKMTLTKLESREVTISEMPFEGNGFNYEAEAFGELLMNGQKESSIMPLTESLEILQIMDEIREKWGLRYPMEMHA